MSTAKVNGVDLYYELHGSDGPYLMLICGLGSHLAAWDPELIEALSRRTRLLLFDNRGSGRSEMPDAEYSMAMFADDAAGLLDALNIERAHILGASMGGMIALEFGLRHPGRVITLIVCCTAAGGQDMVLPQPEVLQTLARVEGLTPEEVVRKNWPLSYTQSFIENNRDWLEDKLVVDAKYTPPPFAFKRQMAAAMVHDVHDRLSEITRPTLVMTGGADILIPPENSDIIAADVPGSVLKKYEGVGHAFMTESREAVVGDMFEFLQRHPA